MTFLNPYFIYFMLPPLILLYIFLLLKKESLQHYFSKEIMDKLRVNSDSLTLKRRNDLLFFAGLLIILASAEPVLEDGTIQVRATGADILIALDISDSMLCEDVYPNRLELAKKKALQLINKAIKYRVGVIAFARNSYLVSPVSFDTKTVSFLLSKLDTTSITQKGTDILTMLEAVVQTNTSTDKKYLLILSDGGDETDFSAEIAFANENGIMIFVLGMGTELGASIKKRDGSLIEYNNEIIISKLNSSISKLAIKTGGVYIQNTSSSEDIEMMLSEIINNSQYKELKTQEIPRYVALFYYPIILAILIFLIAFSSVGKRVKRNASVFILFALALSSSPSIADMFDFQKLNKAKRFYELKDYNSSAKIYKEYAKKTDNGVAYYNAGNSYYKEKQYLKALSAYSFARIQNKELRAKKLSNMGNALTRLGERVTLERAIKHYEASLRLVEDNATRENLEAVKKALQDAKKKEDEQKEEDKEYSEQKTDEGGSGSDKADDTNNKNKNKNKNSKNKNDSKDNKSDDKQKSNNNKKSNDANSKDGKNNSDKDSDDNDNNGDAKKQTKELKNKTKKEVKNRGGDSKSDSKLQEMSDLEQVKWVKKLNSKQNTYLYRLNKETVKNKDKNNKPW